MESISFFTPVVSLNVCEKYFDWGCPRAIPTGKITDDEKTVVELVDRPKFDSLGDCCLSWVITALKVLSYATVVIPLIMLVVKAILRSQHTFVYEPETAKQAKRDEIRKAFDGKISDWSAVVREFGQSKTQLLEQNIPEFRGQFLNPKTAKPEESIFELSRYPGYRFWFVQDSEKGERYFQDLLEAERIRQNNNYTHLVVPPAKLYSLDSEGVIIVQKLEAIDLAPIQKEAYLDSDSDLDDAVRELAAFSCQAKLGKTDHHRDIAIDNQHRFVLLHLRHLRSSAEYAINGCNITGAFGEAFRGGGLLRQVSDRHIPIVKEEAAKYGVTLDTALVQERTQEMTKYRALQQFHQEKGITQGDEPLPTFNQDDLELNLHQVMVSDEDSSENDQSFTLKQALDALVHEMNQALTQQLRTPGTSLMEHRRVLIKDTDHRGSSTPIGYARENGGSVWGLENRFLGQILTKLKEKGIIFDFELVGDGVLIQA